MKAKIILSSIALVMLLLFSCEKLEFGNEFLDKDDSGADVTKDTIFGSYLYANRYLTSAYSSLPYGLPTAQTNKGFKMAIDILESLTDLNHTYSLTWGTVNRTYYNLNPAYNASLESVKPFDTKYSFSGRGNWAAIRACYTIIENADRIPDAPSPQAIKQMKAEAKMIIALHYSDMYRHYGGLPWIEKTVAATETPSTPRLTSLETLDKIVKLIEDAAVDLPWTMENKNDDGRFTKASALGLKARILLFGASPLFNSRTPYLAGEASNKFYTWHGGYKAELWDRAATAAKEMIDGAEANGYKLVNNGNFRKDFQDAYYKRNNGEVLISTRVRYNGLDYWNGAYIFNAAAGGYGIAHPTLEYVDMFPMSDGTPIKDSDKYDENNPYIDRDPRLYETVLINGDDYQGVKAELFVGSKAPENTAGAVSERTGFKIRKFLLDTDQTYDANTRNLPVHWPYLRLAEIYLSYAEALNEANGGPTVEAYEAVNKVRKRVGLGDLEGLNQSQFRQAILTERACEFGYEEVRWYDIIRHKIESAFKNRLHGKIATPTSAANTSFTYKTVELPIRGWNDSFSPKWYLSAFPATEVNKGYGLIQNPGW
ncbi:MAG: RagB/SusD family nutrient uptake outer membrane protein [Chitinophagaceae bacterium]|nr:RagB/SusD family nutrient uptake outer membrane protein [Chitinophagaceae bacterium]